MCKNEKLYVDCSWPYLLCIQTFLLFVLFAFATVPFSKTSRHPQIPVKSEEKKSVDGSDGTKFL